jgi:hypothetical protein
MQPAESRCPFLAKEDIGKGSAFFRSAPYPQGISGFIGKDPAWKLSEEYIQEVQGRVSDSGGRPFYRY